MTEVAVGQGAELPPSWAVVPIRDVVELSPKVDLSSLDDDTLVHFVPMASVSEEFAGLDASQLRPLADVRKGYTTFSEGDVLFAKITPCMENGKGGIVPALPRRYAFGSTEFHVLRPSGAIAGKWLAFYLSQPDFRRVARQNMTGTAGQLRVPAKWLSEVGVPVPPRQEQLRIVEKLEELLSELDAGIAELKAAQRKLAQYRQSLLKAAVEGALTADWRAAYGHSQDTGAELLQRILAERRTRWEQKQLAKFAEQGKTPPRGWEAKYPEPVAPDLSELPALPEGWAWASVDQISIAQKYGSSAKTGENQSGIPVLRMGNIQDGEIDLESLKYLPTSHSEFPDLLLEDGDLLFNRTNSPELVGKTAVYRSQVAPCSYASYLIAVRLSPWVVPELPAAFINSAYGRQWVRSVVTQQVGQANVNGTKLAALAVPLAPFDEQRHIAKVLSAHRESAAQQMKMVDRGLSQAAAQRKNVLKAAFAGTLAPQNPNDEPASDLLARIRAERAKNDGSTPRRRRKTA